MTTRYRLVALSAAVALAAATVAPAGGATQRRPRCADPMPQELTPPGVTVDLDVSSEVVRRGEPMRLELTVRNDGVVPVPYSHGGQRFDFWIEDHRGVIWLWSQGPGAFTDELVHAYLMPGETHVGRVRWRSLCSPDGETTRRGLPGPGRYTARALWVSDVRSDDGDGDGAWWSDPVSFRIRPAKKG